MIVIVYFLRYHKFKIFEIADSAFFCLIKTSQRLIITLFFYIVDLKGSVYVERVL